MAGGIAGIAISGNIGAAVEANRIRTQIGDGSTLTAGKNAFIESYLSDYTVDAAGNIAVSGASAAVGATIVTLVKNNDVTVDLGASAISAFRSGYSDPKKSLSGAAVNGVYVGANAKETQFIGAAGMAVSGAGVAVNGEVVTVVNNNRVLVDASRAKLNSVRQEARYTGAYYYEKGYYGRIKPEDVEKYFGVRQLYRIGTGRMVEVNDLSELDRTYSETNDGGNISVVANDDTRQMLLAGGLNASATAAAGAAVVTLVSNKKVKADTGDMTAWKDVSVLALNSDEIRQLAVSAGISAGTAVQVGAAVQVLKSRAIANVGKTVTSKNGSIYVSSDNTTDLTKTAGSAPTCWRRTLKATATTRAKTPWAPRARWTPAPATRARTCPTRIMTTTAARAAARIWT
ncbi:MAG: hypothetical protein IJ124_09635 [Clostridia bacterium]|nr:hypothetical protein [Clostridia bacterium]